MLYSNHEPKSKKLQPLKLQNKYARIADMLLSPCEIKQIFIILNQNIHIAEIELEYDDSPYLLLISVLLSAQSTDKQVNKATESLFKIADTPQKMLELGHDGLVEHVKTIGLYKTKAKNIIALSEQLITHHNSQVPNTREALMTLPGIGRKSADVMLNVIFKKPTIPVDTHVFRVCHRLGIANISTRDKLADYLESILPDLLHEPHNSHKHPLILKAHHLLVLHGRYTCLARKPKCHECPLRHICIFHKSNTILIDHKNH